MTLVLTGHKPFAQGGNRLCFVHPEAPDRCIKVRRPDFSLEDLRRSKGFPKNLRPLKSFDDNLEEWHVINTIAGRVGARAFEHIYRCFGFVETDLGPGLECELIRDASGLISLSLKQYLWENGCPESCQRALADLKAFWLRYRIPSRRLLTHNIVAQQSSGGEVQRLVVIDGLGGANLLPWHWHPGPLQERRIRTRLRYLDEKIQEALDKRAHNIAPSSVGMLKHRNANPHQGLPGEGGVHSQDKG